MKKLTILILLVCGGASWAMAQSAGDFFNRAANEYIYKNEKVALNTIDAGLTKYPGDINLLSLKDKINKEKQEQEQKEKQKQEEQKQKEEQEKKEQQKQQEQQKQDEQKQQQDQNEKTENDKDGEKKDQANQPNPEETDEKGQEMDQPPLSRGEKLEEMNLSEEKARMILEAMKNNEIQYIQQNKRKATKKPDSDKPDW